MKRYKLVGVGVVAALLATATALNASASPRTAQQAAGSQVASKVERQARTAAAVELKVMTHNICGAICHKGSTTAPKNFLLNEMKAWPPHIVMLQEVCYGQFTAIRDALASSHQGGFVAMRTSNADCPGASQYGQAIFVKGAIANREEINLDGDSYGNDGRRYIALCYDATVAGLGTNKVKACVMHIRAFHREAEPWHARARWAQLGKLASEMDDDLYRDKQVVVLGGDFNSHAHEASLDPIYHIAKNGKANNFGMFAEADQTDKTYFPSSFGCTTACRSGQPTLRERKYDYIFFSAKNATNLSGGVKGTGGSDHNLYRGRADITV